MYNKYNPNRTSHMEWIQKLELEKWSFLNNFRQRRSDRYGSKSFTTFVTKMKKPWKENRENNEPKRNSNVFSNTKKGFSSLFLENPLFVIGTKSVKWKKIREEHLCSLSFKQQQQQVEIISLSKSLGSFQSIRKPDCVRLRRYVC